MAAALFAAAIGLATWFAIDLQRQPQPIRRDAAPDSNDARPIGRLPRTTGYAGDESCAKCHAEISESYRRNGMARSWKTPGGSTPNSEFPDGREFVEDSHTGYRYRALLEQGRVVQEETRLETHGTAPHQVRQEARFSVGSGDHAQAFVSERNGYLYQLPLAWFAHEQRWKFNPGYELLNRRFDRPITPGCIACHGTHAELKAPARNRYELPIHDGISCQRCHGPGTAHVAYWEQHHDRQTGAPEQTSNQNAHAVARMVDPAKLSAGLANDVCLQCHLQGDVTLYQPGHDAFSFRPGAKLSDHRLDFLVKTDQPEAFGVASHGARMLRSRCHLEGDTALTCILCHDPHVSIREVTREHFDARCVNCHAPEKCGREAPIPELKRPTGCVQCHMPQRKTREGQHLVFTDHWIQRRAAASDASQPVLPPDANAELVPVWPEADPHRVRLGSAYILLHETMMPQNPSLRRGVDMLQEIVKQGAADDEARYWLASGLIGLHQSRPAIAILQELVRQQPDHWRARFRLAIAHDQQRDAPAAIAEYERLVQSAPDWMEPYALLARLYLFRNEGAKAVRLLEQQLKYDPDATTWTYLAAARSLQGVPAAECLKTLESALALDPRHVPALLAQGQFRLQSGDQAGAARSFRQVLTIDPANPAARTALQQLP